MAVPVQVRSPVISNTDFGGCLLPQFFTRQGTDLIDLWRSTVFVLSLTGSRLICKALTSQVFHFFNSFLFAFLHFTALSSADRKKIALRFPLRVKGKVNAPVGRP
ncbi:MAG: hypothetical protein KAJ98_12480, partial [Spirochaetaceae bacterium]|nr:hypothetical protein [Spirochaetaceae bacterium]